MMTPLLPKALATLGLLIGTTLAVAAADAPVTQPTTGAAPAGAASAASASGTLALRPARRVAHAAQAGLLASAWAGARIVAAGEHGVVLLSDDSGKTWRQARSVPVDFSLTGLSFVDARKGWAVGHGGVVLHTTDGGDTWAVQRSDLQHDRPLFAVHFVDAQRGVAVGLWSLVLTTADGGAHWSPVPLATPPGAKKADLNLLGLFADAQGRLYATGERGMLLRSADQGASWDYLGTGYAGSFWTGAAPAPGVLLAAGLRGSLYRSADDGKTWARVDSGSTSAITALLHRGAAVVALGLDGLVLRSADGGATFSATPRADRLALTTGVLTADGEPVLFSRQGTVARTAKP